MLFNSYIFIFLFLPLCLVGYFLLNRLGKPQLSHLWLFGMSLWFYGSNTPKYLVLILASIAINFVFYRLSQRLTEAKQKKVAMIAAVVVNLGILFYYKYFNFFIDTVNALLPTEWTVKNILLPLGISFFTFQQVSFVVDAFKGEVPSDYGFLDYACFVTFFPQLVAGPIVTHDELVPQLMDEKRRHFNLESFNRGVYIFSIGLAKKVLLADTLSYAVNTGYGWAVEGAWELVNTPVALIIMLSYTLQIYFDFSGYSDMAIGIGKMFNIDLPQNFNSPYKALSIGDYWKRWHLTLTRFLTRYIYIPLGGSRKGAMRTNVNILLVYLISGLWHGAGWTYIFWGFTQGVLSAVSRITDRRAGRIPKIIRWNVTFIVLNLCIIFFRAPSLPIAFGVLRSIFSFDFSAVSPYIFTGFCVPEIQMLLSLIPGIGYMFQRPEVMATLFLSACVLLVSIPKNSYEKMKSMRPKLSSLIFSLFLLLWCIFCFGSVSEFLYFNF